MHAHVLHVHAVHAHAVLAHSVHSYAGETGGRRKEREGRGGEGR
jgi:hypothetical protein